MPQPCSGIREEKGYYSVMKHTRRMERSTSNDVIILYGYSLHLKSSWRLCEQYSWGLNFSFFLYMFLKVALSHRTFKLISLKLSLYNLNSGRFYSNCKSVRSDQNECTNFCLRWWGSSLPVCARLTGSLSPPNKSWNFVAAIVSNQPHLPLQ